MVAGMLGIVLIIPFASHLPYTFQRTLAFLPLNLSTEAEEAAKASSEWRVKIVGSAAAANTTTSAAGRRLRHHDGRLSNDGVGTAGTTGTAFQTVDPSQQGLALSHDFHNGPLSVVLPFGIWGVIAFLWFMSAGFPVMYRNFRHGNPALRTINTFMWVHYIYLCFAFLIFGGSFAMDMMNVFRRSRIEHRAQWWCVPAGAATGSGKTAGESGEILAATPPAFQR